MKTPNEHSGATKRRYRWMSAGVVLLFLYLLGTEVADRANALLELSSAVDAKEALAVAPESLQVRKALLTGERNRLLQVWNQSAPDDPVPHSESALYAYLEGLASTEAVEILSMEPVQGAQSSTHVQEIRFTIKGRAEYHHLGKFLWRMEAGKAAIHLESLSMKRLEAHAKGNEGTLEVQLAGRATIVAGL
jgi:hypothetical protein